MRIEHLPAVERWLGEPHMSQWWLSDSDAETHIEEYRRRIKDPKHPTRMLIALVDGHAVGFAQWYRWADYEEHASAVGASSGEVGIDYALGEPSALGQGWGVHLVEAVVREARSHHPEAGVVVDPNAENRHSRRCLEKVGFQLVDEREVPSDSGTRVAAIYRLSA